jgi:phosphatidylglycerophosphatase A
MQNFLDSLFIQIAFAQNTEKACNLLKKIEKAIIDPVILLLFAVALVVFFMGIIKFINNVDNVVAREEGKRGMISGVVGMVIMVSVYAILNIISATVGGSTIKGC